MFRLLNRDPVKKPLTPLELELFYRTTLEHVEAEFNPREAREFATGHRGSE